MDASVKWLLFEGLLPLIGTALLYWSILAGIVVAQTSSFNFKWHEAIDSMGWLYGASVLAIQAAFKGWTAPKTGYIPYFCALIALACFFMLIAAIFAKAADSNWQPGQRMRWSATLITVLVLLAGFRTQQLVH
ncbi:hypothetical protein E8F20_27790 [Pseudomonas sp. BN415]|uniref:hypothetical protein n=1 Tax=Pseudomonas sp. BN415 TaxID=2567889 RepID=UPI0024566256|nr:hypothetical protein [Pseudomonas sp. BN415]MDH4585654.1 hypothetical protein [Pseudomonas sp. BN415]